MRQLPDISSDQLVTRYGLQPHPEGGFYRRIWCSGGRIAAQALPACYAGERPWSTSILFLLRAGQHSRLHRLHSDEIWHFLLGGPLRLAIIHPDGSGEDCLLGQDITAGEALVHVVSGGCWFGAMPCSGTPLCPRGLYRCARFRLRRLRACPGRRQHPSQPPPL